MYVCMNRKDVERHVCIRHVHIYAWLDGCRQNCINYENINKLCMLMYMHISLSVCLHIHTVFCMAAIIYMYVYVNDHIQS